MKSILIVLGILAITGVAMADTCSKVKSVEFGGTYKNSININVKLEDTLYILENGETFIAYNFDKVFELALITQHEVCYSNKVESYANGGSLQVFIAGKHYLN